MTKSEALKIGKFCADRWWKHNKPIVLSKQHIERRKAWRELERR